MPDTCWWSHYLALWPTFLYIGLICCPYNSQLSLSSIENACGLWLVKYLRLNCLWSCDYIPGYGSPPSRKLFFCIQDQGNNAYQVLSVAFSSIAMIWKWIMTSFTIFSLLVGNLFMFLTFNGEIDISNESRTSLFTGLTAAILLGTVSLLFLKKTPAEAPVGGR